VTDRPPPCSGRWQLFDSMALTDHLEARALCLTCADFVPCLRLLADVQRHAPAGGGPEGTWAGRLVGVSVRDKVRLAAEERMFTDGEARDAHAAWRRGERTSRAEVGERVYQRRVARNKHRSKEAS
jgi:hypothetical protein